MSFSRHPLTLPPPPCRPPTSLPLRLLRSPQEAHRLSQLRQQMPDEFAGEVIEEEEEDGDAMEQGDVMDEVGGR